MTDKQTTEASTEATPKDGEILIYIDWQGKKLHGPDNTKTTKKKGAQAE